MNGNATAAPRFDVWGATWTLVRTDFKVRYHGTLMGFFWASLKPLAMFVVLLSVFSFIFATDRNYAVNLIIGLFLYDYFQEATKSGILALHSKAYLIGKSRFPRWILVVASISNPLIVIVVASLAILGLLVLRGEAPSFASIALYVLFLVQFTLVIVAFSLAASVLFLRYRDLNQVWEVTVQAGYFLAPVIYPLDILPERFHVYLYLWPPTPVIQFSRSVLVDGVVPSVLGLILLAGATALSLAIGIGIYRRLAPDIGEHL